MPFSTYRPEYMGSASLQPSGRFEAGSWQSFTLVYTAGRFGIDDTGSIKIGFRFATDFGPVQFDDPKAPGYTTVEASNGAELEARWEFKRNIRPWSRSLYVGVKKHFLAEGDAITIRFGDRRQGSKGVRLQTYCETAFEFRVFVDAVATYDYVALAESPKIQIAPGGPSIWRAMLPTLVRAGEPFRLSIKADDAWGNPSDQIDQTLALEASAPIEGLPDKVQFPPGQFAHVVEGLRIPEAENVVIRILDDSGSELCRTNPLRATGDPDYLHYWGDLHGQSNETLGTNSAREYFQFARDRAFLDISAHQGNDFQITGAFWRELNELTASFDESGRFVAIPGYEWSANTAVGGDRNVFYRHEGRPIYRSSHAQVEDMADEACDAHDARELFETLKDEDCVVWAHCGGRYANIPFAHDGRLETSMEVHSSWGTFEWLVQDALERGYRIGIVGNSDGHKGRVGASYPGASFFGAYGGLTCYLAPELTRDAIFKAMRRRHHYATTGNRLYLDVHARLAKPGELFDSDPALGPARSRQTDVVIMGDIARPSTADAELVIAIDGSAPIERLEIFDGLDLIETVRPYDASDLGARIRVVYQGAEYRGRARTTNWDGSLSLTDNAIKRAEMFNNWNLDRGLSVHDQHSASWKAVTTGNFGGFDLWLEDRKAGRLAIRTQHVETDLDIAAIGQEELVFDAGGLERALKVYRLPERLHESRMTHRMPIKVGAEGDTRPFVRVTQIDGHRAWSSPIYLFRE
ncbi:MAG: DUF3604 domain-containing protein [Alphaproteobacteria bacterium]|nr:DUF3604 domain-containing protein [Alphaproteobacteria bacterium]